MRYPSPRKKILRRQYRHLREARHRAFAVVVLRVGIDDETDRGIERQVGHDSRLTGEICACIGLGDGRRGNAIGRPHGMLRMAARQSKKFAGARIFFDLHQFVSGISVANSF